MFDLIDVVFRGWFMGAVDREGNYTPLIVLAFFGLLAVYMIKML